MRIEQELAALVEANAWTYGPNATALRVLRLTDRQRLNPATFWEPLLEACPRMAPLGYWLAAIQATGRSLGALEEDFLQRNRFLGEHLERTLAPHRRVLIVGHDLEIDELWRRAPGAHAYRHLALDGFESAGDFGAPMPRPAAVALERPFRFSELEAALEWADALVLAGFLVHRQNLLGPGQLRPLLMSAADQTDAVILCATNERRLTLGEGAPRRYREDFRPLLWQAAVTHLISEWHGGERGTAMGWLPLPPEVLIAQLGEALFQP